MKLKTNHKLTSNDEITVIIKDKGIETWNELLEFVKKLPYGCNINRTDFGLVISEKKAVAVQNLRS